MHQEYWGFQAGLSFTRRQMASSSSNPRSQRGDLADESIVCFMVGFGKLAGCVVVEAALNEFLLKDISHVTYAGPEIDWKPDYVWKYFQRIVS